MCARGHHETVCSQDAARAVAAHVSTSHEVRSASVLLANTTQSIITPGAPWWASRGTSVFYPRFKAGAGAAAAVVTSSTAETSVLVPVHDVNGHGMPLTPYAEVRAESSLINIGHTSMHTCFG